MGIQSQGFQPARRLGGTAGCDDRRRICRYAVVHDQAWLGWWGGSSFVNTPARILDISLRGARLRVETPPPLDTPVWFCAPCVNLPTWMEGSVVPSRKRPADPCEVRVEFRKIFPYETFKALVYGVEATRGFEYQPLYLPTEEDSLDW